MRRKVVAGALVVASLAGVGAFGALSADAAVGNPGAITMELYGFVDAPTFGFELIPDQLVPGTVNAAGALTFPAGGFVFPAQEFSLYLPVVDEDFDVEVLVTPEMTQDLTGTVNPQTGNMTLNGKARLKMTSIGDHVGVLVNCAIGPFTIAVDEDEGFAYDEESGNAYLLNYSFGIPKIASASPGCAGAPTVAAINEWLELPAVAGDPFVDMDVTLTPPPGTGPGPTTTTVAPSTTMTTIGAGVTVSIGDAGVVEGAKGAVALATFPLTLSAPSATPVKVKFNTNNGTALGGSDFAKKSRTVTFAPGQTAHDVTVSVKGDVLGELDETFTVALSNPIGASIGTGTATGTIVDDDPPGMTIGDVTVTEGNSGSQQLVFTISLSKPAEQPVRFRFTTVNKTAVAGTDYVTKNTTFTIYAGRQTKTVPVSVRGDLTVERTEQFLVQVSNVSNATVVDGKATAKIFDND